MYKNYQAKSKVKVKIIKMTYMMQLENHTIYDYTTMTFFCEFHMNVTRNVSFSEVIKNVASQSILFLTAISFSRLLHLNACIISTC